MKRMKHTSLILMALCLTAGAWAQPAPDAPQTPVGKATIQINGQEPIVIDMSKGGALDLNKMIGQALNAQGVAVAQPQTKRLGVMVTPNEKPAGMKVNRVLPGGVAAKAGFKVGDVITSAGGKAVADYNSLQAALGAAGETLAISVLREGKPVKVAVVFPKAAIAPPPAQPGRTIRAIRVHPGITVVGGANAGDPAEQAKAIREQVAKMQKQIQEQMKGQINIQPGQNGGMKVQTHMEIMSQDENGKAVRISSDGKSYTVVRDGITNTYDSKAALEAADPAAAKLMGGVKINVMGAGAGMMPMPPVGKMPNMEAAIRKALAGRGMVVGVPAPVPAPQRVAPRLQPSGEKMVLVSKAELQAMIDRTVQKAVRKAMADCMKQSGKAKAGGCAKCATPAPAKAAGVKAGCGCGTKK